MPDKKIYLASASPRRRELLSVLLHDFSIFAADIDETPLPEEAPTDYVQRMAMEKAAAVLAQVPRGSTVIAGDTAVICEDMILGKPVDAADAKNMLRLLSGKTHQVVSAVAVLRRDVTSTPDEADSMPAVELSALQVSHVSFDELPEAWIESYVTSKEPMDKAGAYAIQGQAATRIKNMVGSYSSVVGLPLFETRELLEKAGL